MRACYACFCLLDATMVEWQEGTSRCSPVEAPLFGSVVDGKKGLEKEHFGKNKGQQGENDIGHMNTGGSL